MLSHVEVYVGELRRSCEFWGWLLEGLGYEPYQSWEQGRSWRLGGTYLVFVQTGADGLQAGYDRRRIGLNHLAFRVSDPAAVDRFTEELRGRGVRVLYQDRHPHAGGPDHYAVFFEDPDRIKVELVSDI